MHIKTVPAILSAALFLLFGAFACSDSENRYLAKLNQTKVVIDLGMPEDEEEERVSFIDRALRLFARAAVAQSAPALFSSVTVRVMGADFPVMTRTFQPYGQISMNVPAGDLRRFEVTAHVAGIARNAARSFRGVATVNLTAGATVALPVQMRLHETKLVIPEPGNNRLYVIDTLRDTIPVIINRASLTAPWYTYPTIAPYDVDFDDRGRIYFSCNPDTSNAFIIRIDNVAGSNPVSIVHFETGPQIQGIALDRKRRRLYFGTQANGLYVMEPGAPAPDQVNLPPALTGLQNMSGLAFDEKNNVLYIAGNNGGYGVARVLLDNVPASGWNPLPAGAPDDQAFDVIIKKPFLYVSQYNTGTPANNFLLQIYLGDFSYTGRSLRGRLLDTFYGPRRFIAKLNRGFAVMDQDPVTAANNRVVGFLYFSGLGWYPYQPPGPLAPFEFY